MISELRPLQVDLLANIRATVGQGVRRMVVQAPTGFGKTLCAAAIIEGARQKGNKVSFVVPAISLIDQAIEAFWTEGIRDIAAIQSNHPMTDWAQPVQVCSVQTLASRKVFPNAQVILFDECHRMFEAHKKWLADPAFEKAVFIGLSATPWSKGLGKYFDTLLVAATTAELIEQGYLSKFRVFATGHPDLSNVKTVAGDYHEGQLSEAMQDGTLTADIVDTWKTHWGKSRTLCFGVDVAHAKALQQRFEQAGISCGYQDANTPDAERKLIKSKFHKEEYRVVANIGTLTTGVDWNVDCIILARPTKSEILFTQIIGRGLRTAPGKEFCTILDHSDTTARLGFVTDIHHECLHDGKPKEKAKAVEAKLPKPCPQCSFLKKTAICPNCGYKPEVETSGIIERDGELIELVPGKLFLKKQKKGAPREYTMAEKAKFFGELKTYAKGHQYKEGWCANKFREKFKVWPNHPSIKSAPAVPVTMETAMWLKNQIIRWSYGKRKNQIQAAE